ncbi:MAG: twin-arginine translocase TatA/TatE family subunit [Kiritimatiellae bacterium]|nr:twin-arginine translocase TatA/TatE family subunit [Kiritimatiellia bacterium]
MWNIGPTQLLIVLIIVLVLFGGKKLPDLARSLGRSLGEFKKGKEEGENLAKEEVKSLMDEVKNADVPKVEAAPQQTAAGKEAAEKAEAPKA